MLKYSYRQKNGFTIVELMVSVAIIAILTAVALPNFSDFIIRTRVDNEISALHRLLLTARNGAINTEGTVTVCPLGSDNKCNTNWQNELSVFTDVNGDAQYQAAIEQIVKTKAGINTGDTLKYGQNSLIFAPTGRLANTADALPFRYCPKDHPERARGIEVSTSGRFNTTSDTDNDGKDETRAGAEISCS